MRYPLFGLKMNLFLKSSQLIAAVVKKTRNFGLIREPE